MRTDDGSDRWPFRGLALGERIDRDSLGDLFRATAPAAPAEQGRLLLRRLDRRLLDAAAFHSALDDRSPTVAEAPRQRLEVTWVGEIDGAPCLAHRERPGVTLYRMLAAARRHGASLGERPALAIARDLTRALTELEALRPGADAAHGFLLPQLVWVTDDGTAHLLGAEAAPALRSGLAAAVRGRQLGPDAATVCHQGGEARSADDVYALTCLLLAMLTGREPPAEPAAAAAAIAAGSAGELEEPLRPELVRLLDRNLVVEPTARPDLRRWRSELNGALVAFQRPPTAFDVALHIQSHHGDELALFGEPSEVPAAAARDPVAAPAAGGRTASGAETAPAEAGEPMATAPQALEPEAGSTGSSTEAPAGRNAASPRPGRGVRRLLPVAVAAGAALLITGFMLTRGGSSTAPPAPEPVTAPSESAPPPAVLDTAPEPRPEAETEAEEFPEAPEAEAAEARELDPGNLERLVDEALGEREEDLRQAYEAQVGELERQLEDLDPASEAAARTRSATPTADPPSARPPATDPAPATPATRSRPAADPQPTPQRPTAASGEPATTVTGTSQTTGAAAPPGRREPPPPAETVAPELLHPPKLTYPRRARRLNREAEVTVRVLVDVRGRVVDAELEPGQDLGYGFEEAALEAVRTASYRPATRAGQPAEAWTTIKLLYKLR